jgi:hypothetical protein
MSSVLPSSSFDGTLASEISLYSLHVIGIVNSIEFD